MREMSPDLNYLTVKLDNIADYAASTKCSAER